LIVRSSAILLFFVLAMGYIAAESTYRSIEKNLQERFKFSWEENIHIQHRLAREFGIEMPEEGTDDVLVPAEALSLYTDGVVHKNIPYADHRQGVLDIVIPHHIKTGERLPVFVFIHGGTWIGGTKDAALNAHPAREIGRLDMIYVSINYRLYPRVSFPEFLDDPAAALLWVHENIEHYGGDPERIVVSGHSAGAHVAALLTALPQYLPPELKHCIPKVVLFSGPFDLPAYEEAIQEIKFHRLLEQVFLSLFGGRRKLSDLSPAHMAGYVNREFLLVVGGKDEITPPYQSETMHNVLLEAGNQSHLLIMPGVGHGGPIYYLDREYGHATMLPSTLREFLTSW